MRHKYRSDDWPWRTAGLAAPGTGVGWTQWACAPESRADNRVGNCRFLYVFFYSFLFFPVRDTSHELYPPRPSLVTHFARPFLVVPFIPPTHKKTSSIVSRDEKARENDYSVLYLLGARAWTIFQLSAVNRARGVISKSKTIYTRRMNRVCRKSIHAFVFVKSFKRQIVVVCRARVVTHNAVTRM